MSNAVPRDVGNIRRAFVTFGDLEFSDNVENYKSYNAKISRRLGVGRNMFAGKATDYFGSHRLPVHRTRMTLTIIVAYSTIFSAV